MFWIHAFDFIFSVNLDSFNKFIIKYDPFGIFPEILNFAFRLILDINLFPLDLTLFAQSYDNGLHQKIQGGYL